MSEPIPFPPLPEPPLVSQRVADATVGNVVAWGLAIQDEARAAVLAELRAKVEALPAVAGLHTCWDNHDGPDGSHADGSRCTDTSKLLIDKAAVLALLDPV